MTLIKDIINQNKRLANISKAISELSDETKINAFLVGGCVRDLMLNPLEEAIDVDIMRRISDRVVAIQMSLDGADFIEV